MLVCDAYQSLADFHIFNRLIYFYCARYVSGKFANLKNKHVMDSLDLFDVVNANSSPECERIKYRIAFDAVDKDGSGNISFEEFSESYQKLGGILNKRDLVKIYENGDVSGDRMLDFDEFLAIIQMDKKTALSKLGGDTKSVIAS